MYRWEKEKFHTADGHRIEIHTGLNGYKQLALFDPSGYCREWFDTKGNSEKFIITPDRLSKTGEQLYSVAYEHSTIVNR